jgi:RecB family endonuclease NucS
MRLAAWRIEPDGPVRSWATSVQLEAELEQWIERDPALVLDGLRVVGRQVVLEGGRLDLLGVDPQERWIVVEVKRGKLYRDVLTQALDYASSISTMPHEKLLEIVKRSTLRSRH